MSWLIPAVVATLLGMVVLTAVYWYLYAIERHKYLRTWTIGWLVYTLRFLFTLVMLTSSDAPLILILNQLCAFISGVLIVKGTFEFIHRPMPRAWGPLSVLGALWIIFGVLRPLPFPVLTIPIFTFLGIIMIWTGIRFLEARDIHGLGQKAVGIAFILWGMHKIDFPFLRQVEWFAPWGYLIASLLSLIVAIGIILIYFQRAKDALLQESSVNNAFAALSEALIESSSIMDISRLIQQEGKALTSSVCGFAGYIDADTGHLIGPPEFRSPCDLDRQEVSVKDISGICAESLHELKAVIKNDLADAHEPRKRFLSVPAILDGQLVGLLAFADAPRPYTDADLQNVQRLSLLYALAIRRWQDVLAVRKSLSEKEVLLREVHHRVKNNMQVIVSLLSLQGKFIKDESTKAIFRESQNRIKAMALLHEQIYRSESIARVDVRAYLNELIASITGSWGIGEHRPAITRDIAPLDIDIDMLIPIGLVVNELISNALKHAFSEQAGTVSVTLSASDETHARLVIKDNGIGMPAAGDITSFGGLGLQLVNSLVNQIEGTIQTTVENGTTFTIEFSRLK